MQSIELVGIVRIGRKIGCLITMIILNAVTLPAQYLIEGRLDANFNNTVAHLDLLEGWNDFNSVSDQMTVKSTQIDSSGRFKFEGNELSDSDGIYRIRYTPVGQKVIIRWNPKNYVNFIFSNNDSIHIHNTQYHSKDIRNEKLAFHIERYHSFWAEFYGTENELHQNLLANKFQEYCRENILNTDYGLVNMYCLASSKMDILTDARVYRKVHRELGAPMIIPKYQNAIGLLINTYEFDSVKTRSEWLLVLFLLSLCINFFLLWKLPRIRKPSSLLPSLELLTSKENEVFDLIISNKSNKDISTALFVSDATVKTHVNNIYRKLNVNSRKQAIELYKHKNQPRFRP